ncbi:DUF4065 domain-containing protein [Tenacibaculum dicentrarchi]|nr:DUF4065 domain-containing protein [Tenacibaculum dicentrarchi]
MKEIDIKYFSEYLVYYFNHRGALISNKKLQKLLYYIQAWHLVYFENKLFNETPEAWVHGPVYPSVYRAYKKHKAKPISFDSGISRLQLDERLNSFNLSKDQTEYIEAVINSYGKKSALELELLSHRESPWLNARKGLSDYDLSSTPITIDSMKKYYTDLKRKKESK